MRLATATSAPLPVLRPEVRVAPGDHDGLYVVKDPTLDNYYQFGEQEHFLLTRLDGLHNAEQICAAFEKRFEEPFSTDELRDFVDMVVEWQLVAPPLSADILSYSDLSAPEATPPRLLPNQPAVTLGAQPAPTPPSVEPGLAPMPSPPKTPRSSGSLLAWRFRLLDPDTLFAALAPKIAFLWTPLFALTATALILTASCAALANRAQFAADIPRALSWQTALLAWVAIILAAFIHESAHGLTCKRYGGEVHEIGFLFLYFTPCFYCDVSDAWMMKTSRRVIIMLAGSAADLLLWAAAILFWRATIPGFFLHDLAWMIASICGIRVFLNANPLIKLDGYYLLSDILRKPNLRDHSWNAAAACLRRTLWGAPLPPSQPRGAFLLFFGFASWLYSAALVGLMLFALLRFFVYRWGPAGIPPVALLAAALVPSIFAGLFAGEVIRMIATRHTRTILWTLGLMTAAAALGFGQMHETASGAFTLRASRRIELRAPTTGFLRDVYAQEGQDVTRGNRLARMEIPDLAPRLEKTRAQLEECAARRKALDAGYKINPSDAVRLTAEKDAQQQALLAQARSLEAELAYLEQLAQRQNLCSPIAGVVLTPRVSEKIGQYLRDGETICELEDPASLEVEIALPEQDLLHVRPGQRVALKVRAAASGEIPAHITRIAPIARAGEGQGAVTVYCSLDQPNDNLRSGMTGYARIEYNTDRAAFVLARRFRHFLRTEFWW